MESRARSIGDRSEYTGPRRATRSQPCCFPLLAAETNDTDGSRHS
jgi:hypothetical protein